MVGGAGGWSTAARQPQPERCQLWRRRPLAARSGATARTSTQSAARGAALRRHGWHGHARCGACAGYGSSFFQVKSAYLTAKTPKISRLARRARGALRRLARLRRAGSQVYSFSDIGSKCFTYSEHHSWTEYHAYSVQRSTSLLPSVPSPLASPLAQLPAVLTLRQTNIPGIHDGPTPPCVTLKNASTSPCVRSPNAWQSGRGRIVRLHHRLGEDALVAEARSLVEGTIAAAARR
jgi:hypothetical protein